MKIENLFFDKICEHFNDSLLELQKSSGLSPIDFSKKISKKFDKIVDHYDEAVISAYIQLQYKIEYKNHLDKKIGRLLSISDENESIFKAYFTYLTTMLTCIDKIINETINFEITVRDILLINQYLLLIRLSEQIGILSMSGYSDGAFVIWRSLYEHSLSFQVLMKFYNDELSEKFIAHNTRNEKRRLDSFEARKEELKLDPIKKKIVDSINKRHSELKNKYGENFLENDYGWAEGLFNTNKKVNLRLIEEEVKMGKYRPYYIMASGISHSSNSAIRKLTKGRAVDFAKIINPITDTVELFDVLQFTLSVLENDNKGFIKLFSAEHEFDINTKLFNTLYRSFKEAYTDSIKNKA